MPIYQPELWNDGNGIQLNNNCYDYCRDEQTGNFTQPGEHHEIVLEDAPYECREVSEAAVTEGLVRSAREAACGAGRWKVALVIDPDPLDSDFHWYRQDDDGWWSHKPGETQATNLDDAGNRIRHPDQADTGAYTQFCGYFCYGRGVRGAEQMARAETPRESIVQMLLYSGRDNPSLVLDDAALNEVRARLENLPPVAEAPSGGLGYAGCLVRYGGTTEPGSPQEVRAFKGVVSVTEGGRVSHFGDEHGLEQWLIERFRGGEGWEAAKRRIGKTREPGPVARALLDES